MSLDPIQQIVAKSYAGGEFANITDPRQAEHVGDSLFSFLMRELSHAEGCEDFYIAMTRIITAIRELYEVYYAIEQANNEQD